MSRYDDIINLPHHVSPTRKRMSMHDRAAAQFAPFAALVGYDDAVAETVVLPKAVRNWTSRSSRLSMNAWRISPIISTNSRKFALNTLSPMIVKAAGLLWKFPARSKKYPTQMQPSRWLMVAKYDYQTSLI